MSRLKKVFKYSFFSYLIYIFIFSFAIFSFHSSHNKKEDHDDLSNYSKVSSNTNQVALIERAEDAISVRLDLIENAESQIYLAYYRWSDGKVSDLILGSLLEAADRGVEVRILLDGILELTNFRSPMKEVFLGFESHPNIDIKLYEAFNPLLPIAWNHRMHDKMMLVDQQFGLTGGRNIQDRFFLEDADNNGLVMDREVLLYHPDTLSDTVIHEMESYYNQLWNYRHTKEKYKRMTVGKTNKAEETLTELRKGHNEYKKEFLERYFPDLKEKNWVEETLPTKNVHFISNSFGRMNQDPKALKTILSLSKEAKDSIFIQSPYFIPSRRMLNEVNEFNIDPKKATLFTNSEAASPNVAAISAYNNRRKELVDSGARIVEYQGPGSSHAKSSIFDEQVSVVGTFNMDPRSAYINTESMVIIDSEEFAGELKGAIAEDFENSLVVGPDYDYLEVDELDPAELPLSRKMMIRALSLLTPLFEKLL